MIRIVKICALFIAASVAVGAQAWTQPPGGVYAKVTQGFSSTDERYSADGAVIPYNVNTEGAFADRSTYVYTEVGLTSRVTLVGQVSYKRLYVTDETFTPTFERRSFAWGTLGLGARVDIGPSFRLAEDALTRVAVNTKVSIPLGYTRNYNPAVGSGQADVEATINIGRSLWPLPGYVQAGVGYRYRTAFFGFSGVTDCTNGTDQNGHACLPVEEADPDFGDEFLVTAEGGAQLGPVLLQLLVDAQWSFRDPASIEESEFVIQPEGFALQRYVRVGAGTTVYLPAELGVSFQMFAAAHAQNALRGAQYFLGVEKKF